MRNGTGGPPERFRNEITPLVYDLQTPADLPDVAFWVQWCSEVGGPVLELGCGGGRVSIPLARAGVEVIGVDTSEPMLKLARENLARESEDVRRRVELHCADMREFTAKVETGCAIIPIHTFAVLLTREDQNRALTCIRESIRPGGRLAFDISMDVNDAVEEPQERTASYTSADRGIDVTERRWVKRDVSAGTITFRSTYLFRRPEGIGQFTEHATVRIVSREEIERALITNGFSVETIWGNYDRSPYTDESPRMIFVARKGEP